MRCNKCNVNINSKTHICPLCKNELEKDDKTDDVFPKIPFMNKRHGFFLKILTLIFMASTIICIVINLAISKKLSWSLIVAAAIACVALSIEVAIKKRHNFTKLVFSEYIFIVIGSVLWDYFTGWNLWSLNYVLPLVSMAFIYISFIVRFFFSYQLINYFMNLIFACIIGFIPMVLLMLDVTSVKWTAYVSNIASILLFCSLVIFDGKKIRKELESRFHV